MAAIHFIDGAWVEGNPPILGPLDHAAWLGSTVFDGSLRAQLKALDRSIAGE